VVVSALANLREVAAHLALRGRPVPAQLRRGLAIVEAAPEAVQPRLAAAVAERCGAALTPLAPWSGDLCPSYPRASRGVQARLALGEAPAKVLAGLTPREAHQALAAGVGSPADWILRDVPAHGIRTVAVARWVAACWADPARRAALEATRTERVAGAEVEGRLLDRVDEIAAADLAGGAATGVVAAFEAAGARAYAAWERGAESDESALAPTPRWWRALRADAVVRDTTGALERVRWGSRLLGSAAALCREGREQRHCVGTYAPHVRAQRSVIVSIAAREGAALHRSTAELDRRTLEVRQHRGFANRDPHPACERALAAALRRWEAP